MSEAAVVAAGVQAGPEISVVVPCYNEVGNVGPLVAALERALAGLEALL